MVQIVFMACLIAAYLASSFSVVHAQTQPAPGEPALQSVGTLHTNLLTGLFEGKVCLLHRSSNAASAFSLNAGLNVARVTDADGHAVEFEGWYAPGVDGEARVYRVASKPLSLCVTYVGLFPVYAAHDAPDDFKGLIAFNGASVRAAEQAAWLPTPFNEETRSREGDTAYDLTVKCEGCGFLYMNGSEPAEEQNARFVSTLPRPPLLFGGTGPITRTNDLTILNENVPAEEAAALSSTFGQIKRYYGDYLGQPLADRLVLLRMITLNQADRDRRGSSWGFTTWPTIALSGSTGQLARELLRPVPRPQSPVPFLAHESAHYYFGTVDRPSGPYFWFLLESTAEFLSMKAEEAIEGDAAGKQRVVRWSTAVANDKTSVVPLDRVTTFDQIGDMYRYNLGPLLLLDLEREVGQLKMKAFLCKLLASTPVLSWNDLKSVASSAGITETEWNHWQESCIDKNHPACLSP